MDISHNKRNGAIAEFRVIVELLARNFVVSVPQGEYAGYDMIADNHTGDLHRLQIKSTNKRIPDSTGYRVGVGRGKSRKKPYTSNDCDFIVCVVFPDFYIIPVLAADVASLNLYPEGNSGKKTPANYVGRWEKYKNAWDVLNSVVKEP